jgi:zinc D-Ala-D-Ala dipeptidase
MVYIDRRNCYLFKIEDKPRLSEIKEEDGFFFNETFTKEKRVRSYIYKMLKEAKKILPKNYHFMIYEAYKPMNAQIKSWNNIKKQIQKKRPDLDPNSRNFLEICDIYVANPYDRGSGHQAGASIDLTLCDSNKAEYDMGTKIREFSELTNMNAIGLTEKQKKNRQLLKKTMETVGFVNYPNEWWHFSFGDFLWAQLTNTYTAIFENLDL